MLIIVKIDNKDRHFLHILLNEIFLQLQLIYLFALSTMKTFLNCALSMKESGFNGKYVIKPRAAGILGISSKIGRYFQSYLTSASASSAYSRSAVSAPGPGPCQTTIDN